MPLRDLRPLGREGDLPTVDRVDNTNPARPEVVSSYRDDEAIRAVLQEICSRPAGVDEPNRRRAVAVLDDLAEEMIGRSHPGDPDLKIHIQQERTRWASASPPLSDLPAV